MFQINLPLTGMEIWWPGLIILGLGIGFLTGMFGAGGGFLLTPALKIFFGILTPSLSGAAWPRSLSQEPFRRGNIGGRKM